RNHRCSFLAKRVQRPGAYSDTQAPGKATTSKNASLSSTRRAPKLASSMYLLDTNHCSGIIDGNETLLRKMDERGDVPIATSFITRAELLYMAFNSEQRDGNIQKVSGFLAGLNLYLVDFETIEANARLKT